MSAATLEAPVIRGRFKLLEGLHYDQDPTIGRFKKGRHTKFVKGDIVESTEDLVAKYPNKFERLIDGSAPVVVTEARKKAVQDLILKGVWGPEDKEFLENLSEDGFTRVVNHAQLAKVEPKRSPLGDDVTDSFSRAYDEGFKVYRNAQGKHQITRGTSKPLNLQPLEQNQVEAFVEKYLKENK